MGCCCSIKNNGSQSLGRIVECPRCGRVFHASTTNYIFNEHLDQCLMGQHSNQIHPEEYIGITYWEKIHNGSSFKWVQNTYQPQIKINEANIAKENFGQKQIWLRSKLIKFRIPWQNGCTNIQIELNNLLPSSIKAILNLQSKLLYGEIKIKFKEDEIVQDAGGLLREWSTQVFQTLVRQGFLQKTDTEELAYKFNLIDSEVDHRRLFSFLGILVGKCLFEKIPLNAFFDRTIIKLILGQKITIEDILYYDSQLYQSWSHILEKDVEILELHFMLELDGRKIELKPNGSQIKVTQDNVKEYVDLSIQWYCRGNLEPCISDFLSGIYQVIPKSLLMIFTPEELEMLLFGLPFIELSDWNKHTEYKNCSSSDEHIKWFWEILDDWDQTQLQQFLRFCTGSSRVPVEGFSKLESNRGEIAHFCIQTRNFDLAEPYPQAHTCFNRIELPKYPIKKMMQIFLTATLSEALQGQFGLE